VVIAGENGSGKSTLLNIIGKMDNKSDGVVTLAHFNYDNLTKKDEDEIRFNYISYIFQASNLVNYLTVYENLEIICQNNSEKIKTALKTVDMEDYELRFPNELSQGQQQRVCLARAMLSPTPILLADEPTSSLDPAGAKEVARLLKEVSKDKLVLVVTHDLKLFADYDRCIVLERGKIIEDNIINKCETLTEVDNITRKATLPIKPIINASKRKIRKNIGSFIVNVFMVLIFILGITVVANIPFKFNYKI
ncbi:MAG: ATP-binding cassette domain-containing protein, partial [Clostridia bacterium]